MISTPLKNQKTVHQSEWLPFGQLILKWATWKIENGINQFKSLIFLELNNITGSSCRLFRQVSGELFAQTSKYHPFNIVSNSTESSNAISKAVYQRDIQTPEVLQPNSNVLQKLKERILRYIFQDQFFN